MRHDTASCRIGHAAFDAFDDLKLAIDIGRYRLGARKDLLRRVSAAIRSSFSLVSDETRIVMVALAVMVKALC